MATLQQLDAKASELAKEINRIGQEQRDLNKQRNDERIELEKQINQTKDRKEKDRLASEIVKVYDRIAVEVRKLEKVRLAKIKQLGMVNEQIRILKESKSIVITNETQRRLETKYFGLMEE